ncbi:norsolorinic acid reductase [Periconia macrospinosa]|uniref:Norsolorinic acid reductase n=1 Tax=Periconia macrospinosa TaxID=97972 RepID=A0A2V1DTN8_9PLEO|nr:norsolorinic acid reductase [Periconia macrospinosa]
MAFPAPPRPVSVLGRHRILSPTAGVRVSPLCLGAMNFGDAWKDILGECNKETSFALLDYFYSQGGNFIDTSVNYQSGESEQWLGEWMETRGKRDEIVLATKFTGSQTMESWDKKIQSNFGGNSAKNIYTSVERSLKSLRTSYIDLYYVHLWDYTTSIPEMMHALNDLCTARKVLYLGISDTPAWIVVKANCYARQHGLRTFTVYQGRWSASCRDFERDIIPMCLDEGMALAPWGVLGNGGFKSKDEDPGRPAKFHLTGKEDRVREVLESIAKPKGTTAASVALAYVMHKTPYVFPIVGGRKIEHLKGNIEALALRLSQEDMDKIDGAYEFDIGFPHNLLGGGNRMVAGPEDAAMLRRFGYFDFVVKAQPIAPHTGPLDKTFAPEPIGMIKAKD